MFLVATMILLSGCSKEIQIFEDKDAKYELKGVERTEMLNGKYYVKNGTKFYALYDMAMSSQGKNLDAGKCAWTLNKQDNLLPSYYENEMIALTSVEVNMDKELTLERFKDCKQSLGIYGATYKDGYIKFQVTQNLVANTDAAKKFTNDISGNIMIETINGVYVTEDMLTEAGTIKGMEDGGTFEITYYAGTTYLETTIQADTHFYQSYEAYKIADYNITKNGYISIYLPEDLKTGIYRLNGEGFFKYYSYKKGAADDAIAQYNEPYYATDEEQMEAYSQQYTFNLDVTTSDMTVQATFDPKSVDTTSGEVKMMLTSPDGKKLIVNTDKETGIIKCDMTQSIAGKWIVNITPQNITVMDVSIESNESVQEYTKENYDLSYDTDQMGIYVYITYEGEGDVTAQLVAEDGKSYTFEKEKAYDNNSSTHKLQCYFAYLAAGEYKINVYHYPDTKILGVDTQIDESTREIEIITVE